MGIKVSFYVRQVIKTIQICNRLNNLMQMRKNALKVVFKCLYIFTYCHRTMIVKLEMPCFLFDCDAHIPSESMVCLSLYDACLNKTNARMFGILSIGNKLYRNL